MSSASPGSSEGIGVLAAIVIMLLAFGSVIAMGLPILTALLGVGIGFGLVDLLSRLLTVPTFGPELIAMIGLGVGIDYSLFVVTRYRDGLHRGMTPRNATIAALRTSGRAVAFAGGTVIISLLGLSIVIPIKAALMNLLSIGAAYGVIVAVFQSGWGISVFGASGTGPIDPWIPLMMFVITFGLSMDYEMFLLSSMQEEWVRTHDNATAVANGLANTAKVITAAAAIMVCVFGSFVVNDPLRILDVFGLGLAVAILIDATVIRMILVPAVLELVGNRTWWMPTWMVRSLPTMVIATDQSGQLPTVATPT